jgi:single-stranded-DNA-specific exonuclease
MMMKEWTEPVEVEVPEGFADAIGGHPLVAGTLVRRGYGDLEAARAFLDPVRYQPAAPAELPNLTQAVERLWAAIRRGETICVWGDFDVDGQTATTLLVSTLKELGAVVRYYIPNRDRESHGVNLPKLEQLIEEGMDLLLTCDTGIDAHQAVDLAETHGVDVIVTDHHDLPPDLPQAIAVVNPKMLPGDHPLHQLPGVGVAYKVAQGLYSEAGRPAAAEWYLDMVALGIVADVAVQTGDTRYLLQRGLEGLRHSQRLGLQAVMETAGLSGQWLTEEHIGFVLAPRLNALGRLADANAAVELLTTEDLSRARILAAELEGLNARRKLLCDQVTGSALAQIERDPSLLEYGALVLSHETWPAGVVGIVASRLAERFNRPTILIATPDGQPGRGSARSVEGINITAAIAASQDMLGSFGGHPMAAGLSIDPERIPDFRRALSRTLLEMVGEVRERPPLPIAGYLSLGELTLDLVDQLERLAPFGAGNPPLTLASRDLSLLRHTSVGRNKEHRQLIVEDAGGTAQKVIWWNGAGMPLPEGRFDMACAVRASDYRGQREVQVEWVDARPIEEPAAAQVAEVPAGEVVDHRGHPNPLERLAQLRSGLDVQVWSEGEAGRAEGVGLDRYQLRPSKALVIWTTPPGPDEMQAVLEQVSPEQVFLFAVDPGLDTPGGFLKRLAGLAKHGLGAHEGRVSVARLAAAIAHRQVTVRAGVGWLAARGHIAVLSEEGDGMRLARGSRETGTDLKERAVRLKALLDETAAYRVHFGRADIRAISPSQSGP